MAGERPRIGVSRWEDVDGERFQRYLDRVIEAGAEPVELAVPGASLSGLAGLILTGGIDVDPAVYGEPHHATVKQTDPARDDFELALVGEALKRDLPVLAICRGHQVLNVAFGGKLLQHIESGEHRAHLGTEGIPSRWHSVRLEGRLRGLFGADEVEVNSRHHQAVLPETLAAGLRAIATSPEGLVEAVESATHRWVIGVQWHPERPEREHPQFAPASRQLFAAFVREAQNVGQPV